MKNNSLKYLPAQLLAVVITLFSLSVAVQAADRTWSGSGATPNWSDTGNWDTVPVGGDNAIFSGSGQMANVNDIAGLSLGFLWLNNGGYAITGNPITLTSGLTNSFDGNTLGLNVTLGAPQSFSSQSGTLTLLFGAGLSATITNNGNALTFTDGGDFLFQGAVTGTGSLIMNGTGNLTITNRQPLTGGIIVNSGTITFNTMGNLNFGGAETPSLITINTNGTVVGGVNATHAIGGGTAVFVNRGDWKLNAEDYKQYLTMWDGTIEPGPSPNSSGGQLRVGSAGGTGSWTWYVSNSITGSTISSPLSTIGAGVNLTLDVARGAAPSDLTISGVILGAGNITVVRNGITTLSGVNTQTGTFTIAGGTVVLGSGGSLASSVITVGTNTVFDVSSSGLILSANQTLAGVGSVVGQVNDNTAVIGAAISPGGDHVVGTLTVDNLSLNGNAALNFDLASTTTVGGGINDLLIVTNLSLSGVTTVNFTFSGTPAAGAYTLITYPLGQGPAAGPVTTLAAAASRSTYTFTSTGTSIQVTVVANPAPLVWRGDGTNNNWDLSTSSNWINGAVKDVFLTGDNATFNDTGSNTPPINLVGALSANLTTVSATKDYTFGGTGKITGGGKLLKSNSGNLTILTANDNSGGGGLNGSGVVTVGSGGTTVANLGTGNLTNNTKVTFFENASVTYAGNMSGTGSVTAFMPAATLTLTGSNTFTGGLTVQNGTLQIGNASVASVVGNITNYSTLNLYRSDSFTNQNNITSAGNTLEYGNGDINVRGVGGMTVDGTAGINLLPQGSLSIGQSASGLLTNNPGGVINIGANFLLGNPNAAAYFGTVVQNGGTISVGNQVRIGHWASEVSTYTMNGGVLNVPNNQLAVGWDGIGMMYMNGGTVNCRTLNVDDNGATGAISGTNSTFTMIGGTVNIGTGGIGGNTATIILSGGTIGTIVPSVLVPAGWSSSMAMILTNNGPTFDSSNSLITLSGILSGKGGLTKQGSGYLNLNGVNTYTNTTTVAAGTLQGSGTIVGPIVVQSGANLSAGATLATGTLTTSNLTMNSGAGLIFDLNSTANTGDQLVVKGALALDSVGTPATLNFLGGTPSTAGPYTLITNLVSGRTGHLVLAPTGLTRYAATVDESNPNRIQVSFSGTNAGLVWKGNVSTNWNINTDANWLNAGAPDKYYQSDIVLFDDTGISQSNVNLSATMTPAKVSVDAAGSYTLSGGSISGVASLVKLGAGKLTLVNSNNYTGGTAVEAGTLQIGNGGTAGYVLGNISDFGSVVFNRSDTVNFNGSINGPGTLTQAGTGTLLITATQNHYGGSTINPGSTVQLGNGALGDSGSLGNGMVTNNGTVNFYRLSSIAVATPYTGGGNFNFLGTGNAAQSAYSLNATNTFTGPVTLNYARIQSGAGAQSFGSPSSITVNPGSQVYATATPQSPTYNLPLLTLAGTGWQDGLGALRIENLGNWAGPITLAANARIGVNAANTNIISGTISGNYELETYGGSATAALVLSPSSANSYNALRVSIGTAGAKTIAGNNNAIPNNIPLTMNGGTLWLNGFSKSFSPLLNLSGSSSIQNGSTTSPALVTLAPPLGTSAYSGTFADGATQPLNVTFTQSPGLWTLGLSGASASWTGNLTNNGGMITSGTQNTPFGSQGIIGRSIVGNNGATFVTTINNALNGYNGNVVLNNSTWICNRYISMTPNAGYLYLANSTMTGTNSSDGNYENWQLPSTVTVRGTAPSYMLGAGTSPAYDLQSAGTTFDVADVTGNANSDLIVGGGSSTTFLHPPANTTSGGSLTKTGAGTLELDGANTYTGPTTISQGTLTLGASGTIALTPAITIAGGAKLDVSAVSGGLTLNSGEKLSGSGTVNGSISDASNTAIQPGGNGTAGTLTITTNLTLGGSGSLNLDLSNATGSGNDKIVVGGILTVASASTPTPVNFNFLNGAPALGTPYTLIQGGSISGTVATGFTNASRFAATFSQSGNNVVVTFSGSSSNLVWTGTDPLVGSTWDVATSTNWTDGSGGNIFYQNDTVRFDDTSANYTVTLNSTVTPKAIVVDTANTYEITGSGAIAGSTGIIKTNTGTLTLNTVNTFTGPINVDQGKLTLGKNDSLPPGAVVTVAPGAVFDFTDMNGGTTTRGYSFTIAGAGPDGNGSMVDSVDGGGIASFASVSNLTLTADAVISGIERWDIGSDFNSKLDGQGHNLTIAGSGNGKIDLRSQIMTNVASITISNPITWYENFDQTNAWTAATTNYVASGSSIGIYGARTINVPLALNGATVLNYGGGSPAVWTGPVTVTNGCAFNNSAAQNFWGPVSGPGAMWVNGGTATLTFSNASTFSGGVVISNAPTTTTAANASAGTAAIIAGTATALGTGPITINGLNYPALTTNSVYFMTNVLRAVEFNLAVPGTVPNNIVFPSTTITNVGFQCRNSGQVINLTGQISGGFVNMTNWIDVADATGGGVVRYANTGNNFVGNSTLFRGTLAITGDGSLGNSANVLRLNTGSTANGLRFDAPGINLAHAINITASIGLNVFGDNNGDGTPDTANNATISGIISSTATGSTVLATGGTNIAGTSVGSLTLSGVNTFNHQINVDANTKLIAASAAALGGNTYFAIVNNGGTLSFNLNGTYSSRSLQISGFGVLNGGVGVGAIENLSGANTNNNTIQLNAASSIGLTAGSLTLGGAISGAYPLTLTSASPANTLTLTAAETYTGGTFINSGTVLLNGSLPAANFVNLSAGATLGGSGTINCPVTTYAGSVLQPGPGGNNPGKLTVNSPLNLGGNTVMFLNKTTGTNSLIAGLTTVVYGGTLSVTNLGGTLALNDKFTLFSAGNRLGSFTTLNLPALGTSLGWSNSLAIDGSIQVVTNSGPPVSPYLTNSISGNQLNLSWPAGYWLESQTNGTAQGLGNNWVTNSSATSPLTITINPSVGTVFYRLIQQ